MHKLSASERGVYAASLSLLPQLSLNSNLVGSFTLKRPDRRRAEAALWRAAKAEGRASTNRQLRAAPRSHDQIHHAHIMQKTHATSLAAPFRMIGKPCMCNPR